MGFKNRYEQDFAGENLTDVQVTVPDLSLSVKEILELSIAGQDVNVDFVPDRPYGDPFEGIPNVDELGVMKRDEPALIEQSVVSDDVKTEDTTKDEPLTDKEVKDESR